MEQVNVEESEKLVLEIVSLLIENEQNRAKLLVHHENSANLLKVASWDMVSKVCELITDENSCKEGFLDTCEEILVRLCEVSNVKELLLVLLEQADRFNDDVRYIALLTPLQKCLQGLPSRRGHSLNLVFETLYTHISTLEKPEDQPLEGQERKLLDSDPAVWRISKVLSPFLTFLEPFITEAAFEGKDESIVRQRDELIKCLIKVLDHPLAYLDLTWDSASGELVTKSQSRILTETVMQQMATVQSNFAKYLFNARVNIEEEKLKQEAKQIKNEGNKTTEEINGDVEDDEEDEKEVVPELGTSVFAYLIFSEQLQQDNLPQVMTHQYWLELNLPFITCLLEKREWLVQEKGVALLGNIVNRIPKCSLPSDFFGTYRIKLLLKTLLQVLCTGQNKELCQSALKHFTTLLLCFEHLGRYKFILFILKKSKHSGILGYCMTQLKELIDQNLRMGTPDENFCGVNLTKLLKVVFILPDCEKTDLMENSSQIMSALNLLRYLILRDKPDKNVTGIWSILPDIEKTYCDNLRMGINMSRAHFQMDLEKLKKGKKLPEEPEVEFSVGSEAVPGLSKAQKIQMLNVALHTFDMMESVLGRVSELIGQVKKS